MYCMQCGKYNPDMALFCSNCGVKMPVLYDAPSPVESDEIIISQPLVQEKKSVLDILGIALSLFGMMLSVTFSSLAAGVIVGLVICLAGVVLSVISLRNNSFKTVAISGILIGSVGLALSGLMLYFILLGLS